MPRVLIDLSQITPQKPFRIEHMGTAIVVIRSEKGLHAYLDRCPHAEWPLSQGEVSDGVLQCSGHGWRFDVSTGRCLTAPAYRLQSVSASVSENRALIEWNDGPPGSGADRNPRS